MGDHKSTLSQVQHGRTQYLVDLFGGVFLIHAQLLHRERSIFSIGELPNFGEASRPERSLAFGFDETERNYVGSRECSIYAAGFSQCSQAALL